MASQFLWDCLAFAWRRDSESAFYLIMWLQRWLTDEDLRLTINCLGINQEMREEERQGDSIKPTLN